MPKASITAKVHEPLDIHGYGRPKFTFDLVVLVDGLPDAVNFGLSQLVGTRAKINIQTGKYFP